MLWTKLLWLKVMAYKVVKVISISLTFNSNSPHEPSLCRWGRTQSFPSNTALFVLPLLGHQMPLRRVSLLLLHFPPANHSKFLAWPAHWPHDNSLSWKYCFSSPRLAKKALCGSLEDRDGLQPRCFLCGPAPTALASPGNLSEIQKLRPHPRSTESAF